MKIPVPTFIRHKNIIREYGPRGLMLREFKHPSISAAKKHSRELQGASLGSGILRTSESLNR